MLAGCARERGNGPNVQTEAQLGILSFYLFFCSLLSSLSNLNFKFEYVCMKFKPRLNVYIII
jgi:hypothetical protein